VCEVVLIFCVVLGFFVFCSFFFFFYFFWVGCFFFWCFSFLGGGFAFFPFFEPFAGDLAVFFAKIGSSLRVGSPFLGSSDYFFPIEILSSNLRPLVFFFVSGFTPTMVSWTFFSTPSSFSRFSISSVTRLLCLLFQGKYLTSNGPTSSLFRL